QRLRPITTPTQQGERRLTLFRLGPAVAVHAGGFRALVIGDSQNGQCAATERVGEQINQSFDLMPFALPHGLHDTRLEPTNRTLDLPPVDGVPVHRRVGSRTSRL